MALLDTGSRRAAADAAMRVIRGSLGRVQGTLTQAVARGRWDAKRASFDRLSVEWETIRGALQRAGHQDPGALEAINVASSDDDMAGQTLGQAFAASWGQALSVAIWNWADSDSRKTLPGVVVEAAAATDYRLRRAATTETARAFSDARDEGMDSIAELHKDTTWFPALLKTWDATLDRKTCKTCKELDGTTRPWGFSFPGGEEPGYVHPGCRCIVGTLLLPLPIEREAA